jgi:predicted DNA-binding protein YlxM (UPF0122 family)
MHHPIVSEILTLFKTNGGSMYGGEAVTQLEHALQAATFAKENNASDALITAALLHDMCDKKYMNQTWGIQQINEFLTDKLDYCEIKFTKEIMHSMSYSAVKKHGFPVLGKYQMAYHIVREADLLAAYDFDRSIIYHMYQTNGDFIESYDNALQLFEDRIFKHHADQLFITDYSKHKAHQLHRDAILQIQTWKRVVELYQSREKME